MLLFWVSWSRNEFLTREGRFQKTFGGEAETGEHFDEVLLG